MDWEAQERLFDAALDLAPEARADWIREQTEGDPEARERLLSLLAATEQASPLDDGLAAAAPSLLSSVERQTLTADLLEHQALGPYHINSLIGEGGMAEVYEAQRTDGTFDRTVAVKVLRQGLLGEEARARFERERQILASLTHPNIARLYDGGLTAGGRPYFVMERIDGSPITDYCRERELTLTARLELFLGVLEGVEHAHRRGILHRDLKPSNLLVEDRTKDSPRAVVLDFGIAHDASAPTLTLTGQSLGTPGYMAPEQARGARQPEDPNTEAQADGDQRSDVFSLGTVLFELVYERPVYDAGSSAQVLAQALEARIEWPQNPEIAGDLKTILMTALAREPADRYPNVAQLASDVAAFLAGAPLSVRRPNWIERGLRSARRSPRVTASIALVLAIVTALALFALRERWRSQEAARTAQRLGEEIETVDSMLRLSHLLPAHDIRPGRARVERYLERFADQIAAHPGPANYALGRGALALGHLDQAREHLEVAWSADNRRPEVALTLGRTYADVYEREAAEARKIRDTDAQEAQLAALDSELRQPALAHLRAGRDAAAEAGAGSPAFIEALLAFHDEQFEPAERKARQAADEVPWFFEAVALEGRAASAQGRAAAETGDYAEAQEHYERALGHFERGLVIGRSAPELYLHRCTTLNLTLDLARETGDLDEDLFSRVSEQCEEGLTVDPADAPMLSRIARIHWQRGTFLRRRGEDPEPAWETLLDFTARALEVDPKTVAASNLQGLAWMYRGSQASDTGDYDVAQQAYDRSRAAFEVTLAVDENHRHARNNLGLVHYFRALLAERQGEDPRVEARSGIEQFEEAAARDPSYAFPPNNAAVLWRVIAKADQGYGDDPEPARAAGIKAAAAALAINPSYSNALENQANFLLDRAIDRHETETEAAVKWLDEALNLLDRAVEINDRSASLRRARADARRLRGRVAHRLGQDPQPWWRLATEDITEAETLNPQNTAGQSIAIDLLLDQAEYDSERRAQFLRDADRRLAALAASENLAPRLESLQLRRAQIGG